MSLGFGDKSIGLALAELQAALSVNIDNALKRASEGVDPNDCTPQMMADALISASEQSAELAAAFAEKFENAGAPEWASVCRALENKYKDQAATGRAAESESDLYLWFDRFFNAASVFAENGAMDHLVAPGAAASFLKKVCQFGSPILSGIDMYNAWRDGDLNKIAGIAVGVVVGGLIAALGAAIAPIAGAGAIVVLAGAGAMAVIGGETASEGVDSFLEMFGGEYDADAAATVKRLLSGSNSVKLPNLGDFLLFGTDGDDVLFGDESTPNDALGGAGNDIINGGSKNDYLSGGEDNDTIEGYAGDDKLKGGNGDDMLTGGKGDDTLIGGIGFDTYKFTTDDLASTPTDDVIIDEDGQGKILFNDLDISGTGIGFDTIRDASLGTWETSDGKFRISWRDAEKTLVIFYKANGSRIIVQNWKNGDLGITLPGFDETHPDDSAPLTSDDDVFGHAGNNAGNDHFNALAGNDGISAGAGDDIIDGGLGDDLIFGGSGNDRLLGGDGNDFIIDGSELVDLTDWSDVVEDDGKSQRQRIEEEITSLGAAVVSRGKGWYIKNDGTGFTIVTANPTIYPDPNVIRSGDDFIDGGDGDDHITAGEGNDTIIGGLGNDVIVGGHDDDVINGGDGADTITGDTTDDEIPGVHFSALASDQAKRNGNDIIDGGAGDDLIVGGGGNDVIYGGEGDDRISGRGSRLTVDSDDPDRDYIDGGLGNDSILGDDGDDILLGGEGDDVIRGDNERADTRNGNDTIDGGAGNDSLAGDGGDDVLRGGEGNDVLVGDNFDIAPTVHGNDYLDGGIGNDTMFGGGGDDVLIGGDGDDVLLGDADESQLAAEYHGDDYLSGGKGADQLMGGGGNDVLDGGEGNDSLFGQAGNDYLAGGDGDDVLSGGEGDDILNGGAGKDQLWGGAGNDSLSGGDGDDYLDGDESAIDASLHGNDTIDGGAGNDVIHGLGGNDVITGGDGDDYLFGDDYERLFTGNDKVSGGAGNDWVDGGAGDDQLFGDEGNDTLLGGDGNDTLVGGTGNDILVGDLGVNTYVVAPGDGDDSIVAPGTALPSGATLGGVLKLEGGLTPADIHLVRNGDHLTVSYEGGSVAIQNFFLQYDPSLGGNGSYFNFSPVTSILFSDDTLWLLADVKNALIQPSNGNDVITGFESSETIHGGDGNDTLNGMGGDDTLYGDAGDDQLDGGAGNDHLLGGAGNDTLHGGLGADHLEGGDGNDFLYGDDGSDVLEGGAGDDHLEGGAGSDVYVFARGDGHDTVSNNDSTAGRFDSLKFADGINPADVTAARVGDDLLLRLVDSDDTVTVQNYFQDDATSSWRLDAVQFADGTSWSVDDVKLLVLNPTDGNDVLQGYASDDVISGAAGNDTLLGAAGNDLLAGGVGDDLLQGGDGDDVLSGDDGDDTLQGDAGNDQLNGGAGTDTLLGGSGDDVLVGGVGDDQLQGGQGEDRYVFATGDGTDSIVDADGLSTLQFADVANDDLVMRRDGTTLVVRYSGSASDEIRISNFFDATTGLALMGLRIEGDVTWNLSTSDMDAQVIKGALGDDVIFGNADGNVISALAGADVVYAGAGDDTVDGGEGNDQLFGEGGNDQLTGGAGDDLLDGGDGLDALSGGIGNDELRGGAGADTLDGGDGMDHLSGDADDDVLRGGAGDDMLDGGTGEDQLYGDDGDDSLLGNDGNDTLLGGAGNDVLDGGRGIDQLIGGAGDDTYMVDEEDDTIVEAAGEGFDVVNATSNYILSENIEKLVLVEGSGAWSGVGNSSDNLILGNSSANWLDGGAGADTLIGGQGDDIYVVDNAGDQIVEAVGEGTDTVEASIDYVLGATLENLTLLGTANLSGTGNDQDNVLIGNDGNNRLEGGLGADSLYGGLGDDYYIEESSADWVYEYADEGLDTVERRFETNLVLKNHVENLILASGIQTGNGNGLDNQITGNAGDNKLAGLDGDDVLIGLDGNDSMWGGNGEDRLYGGAGNDYLDGEAGVDYLEGGAGNDVYIVDDANDTVVEATNDGTDQVQATASYVLSDNIENLFLMGGGDLDGTGNALDNYLAGNDGDNVLNGMAGNDTMVAGRGNDTLIGGTGDDKYVFDAESGSDIVDNTGGGNDGVFFTNGVIRDRLSFGRDGDDLLIFVDASNTPSVRVTNHFLGGDAAIDYVQPDGGFLLTTAQINQIVAGGGQYDQVIEGTAAGEQLVGSAGKDLIKGLAGDDTLFGMAGNDTLQGGDGDDYLAGGNGSGTGSGDDRLEGGAGNDTLAGEDGNDTLIGGSGDDQYVYGGGQDIIDNTGGGYDGLFFNDGITASQLGFTREGDDLLIKVSGDASKTVRVLNHFLGGDSAIDYVQPATGSMLDTAAINALVGGSSGGTPPGEPGNDADYTKTITGTASGEQLVGTSGRDLIRGLAGNDTLFGMGGDDKLVGGDGDDYLSGGNGSFSGSGNDILVGGAGADTLVGEDGNDLLQGGTGDDNYIWQTGSGKDVIDNTGGGTDWLFFNGIVRTRLSFHRSADDLIILVDGDSNQQVRVQDHFKGGDLAISYVQPSDGYAIPASQFGSLLTPLPAGFTAASFSPSSMSAMSPVPDAQVMAFGAADAANLVTGGTSSDVLSDKRGRLHATLWDWPSEQGSGGRVSPIRGMDGDTRFGHGVGVSREAQQLIEAMSRFSPIYGISDAHEDTTWSGATLTMGHVTDHPFKQRSTVSAL